MRNLEPVSEDFSQTFRRDRVCLLHVARCAGAKLQVDDGKTTDLQILPASNAAATPTRRSRQPKMLAAMKTGKQLKVSFQNLAKEVIAIPMPLTDFAE